MSRLLTLKTVSEMTVGEVVPGLIAQIKELKPIKRGESAYGPWTIQTAVLMDSTAVLQVKFMDFPEFLPDWNGVHVTIESTLDDKGKLRGIQITEYRGKKEIQVKGNAGAKIEQVTEATEPPAAVPAKPAVAAAPAPVKPVAPVAAPSQRTAPVQQTLAPRHQTTQSADQTRKVIADCKYKLAQSANAMCLAYNAALYLADQVQKDHPEITIPLFSPDTLQKIAVTFAIDLSKSGLVVGLPAGPLDAWTKKPQPQQPEEPPQDDIPY